MVDDSPKAGDEGSVGRRPSIYGFGVRTREKLQFLRSGGGADELEIIAAARSRTRPSAEPIADWTLAGTEYHARASLYRVHDGFEFWTTDAGGYHVDPQNGRIEIPAHGDEILREQRLWGVPVLLCYMHRGDFSLHAAAVEMACGAVLLAGPSRYGKTTLAMAFHLQGYRLLSEDLACCRAESCEVVPGPAVLRVRPDVFPGAPPHGTYIIAERPDRVLLGLSEDRRGSSKPVPLKAIVFLRESAETKIEPVNAAAALPDLWHLNFRLATTDHRARSFEQLAKLAASVSVWNAYRPLRRDSLEATIDLIAEHCDR
jgi:hypothetical protein